MYFKRKINLLKKGFLKEEPLANRSFLIKAVIVLLLALFLNLVHANSIPKELSQTDSIPKELSQAEKSIGQLVNRNDSTETGFFISENDSTETDFFISENYSTGTGFFISEKHFVTNLHVILDGQSILLTDLMDESALYIQQKESSELLKVKKVLHISAIYDFALLEIETEVSNYLKLGELEKKEELHVFGYPGGEFKRMIKKKEYPIRLEGSIYFFPVNHFDLFGASGSPVLNNQGEVVGLLSEASGNLTIATQPDILKDLIEGNLGSSCLDFIGIKSCINEEVKNLKNKSEQGNALAQYKLAQGYLKDQETEESKEKAFYWAQASAKQVFVPAQNLLAWMYYEGEGIEESQEKAFYWYQESAKQGDATAQYQLAWMYYEGEGIEENKEKAFYWAQTSAKQGDALAQYELAWMYYEGEVIEENKEKAFYWFKESARQAYAPAQYQLAWMYYEGEVIEENKEKALYWAQASAKQGSAPAQVMLASLFPIKE